MYACVCLRVCVLFKLSVTYPPPHRHTHTPTHAPRTVQSFPHTHTHPHTHARPAAMQFGMPASVLNLFWGVLLFKRQAEEALERSGMAYTIVRPGGCAGGGPNPEPENIGIGAQRHGLHHCAPGWVRGRGPKPEP